MNGIDNHGLADNAERLRRELAELKEMGKLGQAYRATSKGLRLPNAYSRSGACSAKGERKIMPRRMNGGPRQGLIWWMHGGPRDDGP